MMSDHPPTMGLAERAPPREATGGFRRDRVTWASYLALALFSYFLGIQGNIIPFLRDEFGLSYRVVSLHPAALAAGLIVCGLLGERVVARLGRDGALALALAGICGGAMLLGLASTAAVSVAGCLLIGAPGGLVLVVVPAALAERHGANRAIAFGEANAASYAASLTATVAIGLFVASGAELAQRPGAWRRARCGGDGALRGRSCFRGEAARRTGSGRLPATYWAYWATLFCVIALEYCTLLWGPEVLERTQGLSRAAAATAAAAFSAAMLTGRLFTAPLLRRVAGRRLFLASLALTLPGFLLYWGARQPALSVVGLFVLGLGMPAKRATSSGLPLGLAGKAASTASDNSTNAEAAAVRRVGCLALTSTMAAWPDES